MVEGFGHTATAHRHRSFILECFQASVVEALVKNSVETHRMPNFQPCHFSAILLKIKYLKNKHIYFFP